MARGRVGRFDLVGEGQGVLDDRRAGLVENLDIS